MIKHYGKSMAWIAAAALVTAAGVHAQQSFSDSAAVAPPDSALLATAENAADSTAAAQAGADSAGMMLWRAPMLPDELTLAEEVARAEEPMSLDEICEHLAGKMNDYAAQFLGVRYRLGATGPKAFDCSGFTQNVFRNFGLPLNRTSRSQYTQGEKVAELKDLKPGDLMFFSGRRVSKTVGHVAMVTSVDPDTGEVEFIHASSSKGITYQKFPDNGYFSKRYLGARRILGTDGFRDVTAVS